MYTENYRSAKATLTYICRDGYQSYKPTHTFYGFRYIVIDEFPEEIDPDAFTAIAVHSNMKKTGSVVTSNPMLNRLIENIEWGQRGNFLDIPTDCPQRDERLGWTGDAQVFCRTATYQFDTERFFKKWFGDIRAEQWENGGIPHVIPFILFQDKHCSSAWGDAGVICPWQVYLTYGNLEILEAQFGRIVRGMAYPYGTFTDETVQILKNCGVAYCRTVRSTEKFDIPTDWLRLDPTCHHVSPKLPELTKKFLDKKVSSNDKSQLFYLWGHAYEFARDNNWDVIEEFCKAVSGKEDIWHATNMEIYEYVQNFNRLVFSLDQRTVQNPTAQTVWFQMGKTLYSVEPGETKVLV